MICNLWKRNIFTHLQVSISIRSTTPSHSNLSRQKSLSLRLTMLNWGTLGTFRQSFTKGYFVKAGLQRWLAHSLVSSCSCPRTPQPLSSSLYPPASRPCPHPALNKGTQWEQMIKCASFGSSQTWLFQTWSFAIFTWKRSFAHLRLRPFALFCRLAFALFYLMSGVQPCAKQTFIQTCVVAAAGTVAVWPCAHVSMDIQG